MNSKLKYTKSQCISYMFFVCNFSQTKIQSFHGLEIYYWTIHRYSNSPIPAQTKDKITNKSNLLVLLCNPQPWFESAYGSCMGTLNTTVQSVKESNDECCVSYMCFSQSSLHSWDISTGPACICDRAVRQYRKHRNGFANQCWGVVRYKITKTKMWNLKLMWCGDPMTACVYTSRSRIWTSNICKSLGFVCVSFSFIVFCLQVKWLYMQSQKATLHLTLQCYINSFSYFMRSIVLHYGRLLQEPKEFRWSVKSTKKDAPMKSSFLWPTTSPVHMIITTAKNCLHQINSLACILALSNGLLFHAGSPSSPNRQPQYFQLIFKQQSIIHSDISSSA